SSNTSTTSQQSTRSKGLIRKKNKSNGNDVDNSETSNGNAASGCKSETGAPASKKTKEEKCYLQQRSFIQQACLEGTKSSGDIHRMLKSIYGENVISRAQAHNWFKMFKGGRTLVQD